MTSHLPFFPALGCPLAVSLDEPWLGPSDPPGSFRSGAIVLRVCQALGVLCSPQFCAAGSCTPQTRSHPPLTGETGRDFAC